MYVHVCSLCDVRTVQLYTFPLVGSVCTCIVCSRLHKCLLYAYLCTTVLVCVLRNPITTGAVLTPYDQEIVCRACAIKPSQTQRALLPSHVTSTLAYMSEQRKSLSPPSVVSPYSTLSSSSNVSNTSSSSNGPFSPSASAQSRSSSRHHPSSPPGVTSSSSHTSTHSAYGKRRSTSDILDIVLEPDQPVPGGRRLSSSGVSPLSQPPTLSSSMYSLSSSQRSPKDNHQQGFPFEQKAVPDMSSAFTAITETDGQLKLKPVEPQVKAKLGCELHTLTFH